MRLFDEIQATAPLDLSEQLIREWGGSICAIPRTGAHVCAREKPVAELVDPAGLVLSDLR